jgi:hypothetical protein
MCALYRLGVGQAGNVALNTVRYTARVEPFYLRRRSRAATFTADRSS